MLFNNSGKSCTNKNIEKFSPHVKEDVNKNIEREYEINKQNKDEIPKVVYCSYYDIDMIPNDVIENLKGYYKGYTINIL